MYATAATSKGHLDGSLSAQWMSRPDDQRFLNLTDLRDQVKLWADQSLATVVESRDVRVLANPQDAQRIALQIEGIDSQLSMTHWSFDQLAQKAEAPAGYLRRIPAALAAINLQHGLMHAAPEKLMAYHRADGSSYLRALTSPSYGRILDHEVVDQVIAMIGHDDRWKVPGTIDWGSLNANGTVNYDPETPVTKEGTTLYASDRDVCIFLCDDRNPIEVGLLDDGSPDLMFRGFMLRNSETGSAKFSLKTMMLRGVCQNRNLWGVEDVSELTIRHSNFAPEKFAELAPPALASFTNSAAAPVVAKVLAAKGVKFTGDNAERKADQVKLLHERLKFPVKTAEAIVGTDPNGQGKALDAPSNLWQLFNAGTAWARKIPHQDDRTKAEAVLAKMLAKV
jgi:hypothetical protein